MDQPLTAIDIMEIAMVDYLRKMLPDTVLPIDRIEGVWNERTIHRIIKSPPSVFVAWLKSTGTGKGEEKEHHWAITVVAQVLDGYIPHQRQARYLMERIETQLHARTMKNAYGRIGGPLIYRSTDNLWNDDSSQSGISIFQITFTNRMEPASVGYDSLDDFLCYFETTLDPDTRTVMIENETHPRNPEGLPKEDDHEPIEHNNIGDTHDNDN